MSSKKLSPLFRGVVALFVALILLIIAALAVPSARAAAFSWLGLGRAPGSQVEIQPAQLVSPTEAASPAPTASETAAETTVPTPGLPPLADPASLADISQQAGWTVLAPTWVPDGYSYSDLYYDQNNQMVILTYLATRSLPGSEDLTQTHSLTVVEALRNDVVPLEVAAGTSVEQVPVNAQMGAYVVGAWDSQYDSASETMVSTWRSDLAVQNVFWQRGPVYLVVITDDAQVSKADLIQTASSVP